MDQMSFAMIWQTVCVSSSDLTMPFWRLQYQLSYLTNRFADKPEAQVWQFVIWMRQGILFTLSAVAQTLVSSDIALGSHTSLRARVVIWVQAIAALLVMLIAWRMHSVVQPYAYRFQNAIETWLYVSNVLVISLGCAYTFLNLYTPSSTVLQLVEYSMVAVLVRKSARATFRRRARGSALSHVHACSRSCCPS